MADRDYIIRLDTDQVQASADRGANATEQLEFALDNLNPAAGRARDALGRFVAGARAQEQAVEATAAAIGHYNIILDQAAEGGASIGRAFGGAGAGRSILEFSRLIEDAQYGVAGVLNNIPSLVVGLGGGAGLAGAISLAAVGGAQLYRHLDDLTGLFRQSETETEAQRMERLAASTHRSADETKELNKHKREQAALEKLLSTPSQAAGQAAKTVQENVSAVGGPAVQTALTEGIRRYEEAQHLAGRDRPAPESEPTALDRFADEHLSDLGKRVADAVQAPFRTKSIDPVAEAQERAAERAERAGKLLGAASGGDRQAAEQVQAYLEQLPEGQRPALDFLSPKGLPPAPLPAGLTPQEQETYTRRQKEERERAAREETEAKKRADDEAEKQKKLNDQLNQQGLENESAGVVEQKKRDEEYRKEIEALNAQGEENQKLGEEAAVKQAKEGGADIVAGAAAKAGGNAGSISKYLQSQGFDEATSQTLAEDASRASRRDLMGESLKGEKPRNVEVFGSTSAFLDKVQTAVGGDSKDQYGQQTVQELRELKQFFQGWRHDPGGRPSVF